MAKTVDIATHNHIARTRETSPLPLGVMHSNIYSCEVINFTVLLCNP